MTDTVDYSEQIINTICDSKDKAGQLQRLAYEREQAIRRDFENAIKNDPVRRQSLEESNLWNKAVEQAIEEVFLPGTVVWQEGKIYHRRRHVTVAYWVVDCRKGHDLRVWPVTEKYSRKYTESIDIGRSMKIITLMDIEDTKLRQIAAKFVVKVRTKGWDAPVE